MSQNKISNFRGITRDQLMDRIHEWERDDKDKRELYQVLGWTWDEYVHWVKTDEIPKNKKK